MAHCCIFFLYESIKNLVINVAHINFLGAISPNAQKFLLHISYEPNALILIKGQVRFPSKVTGQGKTS
jgi:hypothetical protein